LDLSKFEKAVAELSCCVVLFPEAPGSLVELGFFSSNESIVERLLVVVDNQYDDGKDSFISLGPVNTINNGSDFRPVFVDAYNNFNFEKIKNRINERHKVSSKHVKIDYAEKNWSELSYFQKLSIIHWLVDICRLSNIDDLVFMSKSIFGTTVKKNDVIEIVSILVGSKEFSLYGEEEWIKVNEEFSQIITTKSKENRFFESLKIDISNLYLETPGFLDLIEEAYQ